MQPTQLTTGTDRGAQSHRVSLHGGEDQRGRLVAIVAARFAFDSLLAPRFHLDPEASRA